MNDFTKIKFLDLKICQKSSQSSQLELPSSSRMLHRLGPALHLCMIAVCMSSPVGHESSSVSTFTVLASLCIGPQGLGR